MSSFCFIHYYGLVECLDCLWTVGEILLFCSRGNNNKNMLSYCMCVGHGMASSWVRIWMTPLLCSCRNRASVNPARLQSGVPSGQFTPASPCFSDRARLTWPGPVIPIRPCSSHDVPLLPPGPVSSSWQYSRPSLWRRYNVLPVLLLLSTWCAACVLVVYFFNIWLHL